MAQRDKYIAALIHHGWQRDTNSKSLKRVVFVRPSHIPDGKKVYVGKSGSIRIGRNLAESRPLTDREKTALLDI